MNEQGIIVTGRRCASRLRLMVPASLVTLDGRWKVHLADISQTGARFRLDEGRPISPGSEALISWLGREAFGDVVWCAGGYAGMVFEEQLPLDVLLDTREKIDRGLVKSEDELRYMRSRDWFLGGR